MAQPAPQHALLVLDGGMGRQLQAMGAPFRQPEWSALALMQARAQRCVAVAARSSKRSLR
jgi:S-methylmethionine-dependent homocysteine/selenocysteine methylase